MPTAGHFQKPKGLYFTHEDDVGAKGVIEISEPL